MNKIFRTSLVLLTALPFAACQNDVQAPDNSQSSGKPVRLEIGLTYGDDNTRTTLQDVDGNLKCTWDKGDRVIVSSIVETGTTGNAVRFGEITLLDDYAGQVKGYFAGELIGIDNFDGKEVLFTYAGKGVETKDFDIDAHKLSIATQDGTLAGLTKYDILRGYTEVSVAGGIAYTPDMALTRYVAFAHFTLSLPQGVTRTTEPVTISGEGVKNYITYNKRPGIATGQEGAITVNGSGNDLYVVLIPGTVAPEFVVTIGGKTYTGSLPSVKVEKGKYYRDNTTHAGIPVEMSAPTGVDHTKNPLLKWAETNLERVSDSEFYKAKFADSYTDNGHYYQFGRQVGFIDYKEANDCGYVYQAGVSKNMYDGTTGGYIVPTYSTSNLTSGEKPMGFLISNGNIQSDWWPSNTAKNDDWSTRAKASGYNPEDMFIIDGEKWRMPKVADFAEILPEKGYAGLLDVTTAIKTINETPIAFRWSRITESGARYLKIEALVVSSSADISSVNWNDDNKVVRYFKATGSITPVVYSDDIYHKSSTDEYLPSIQITNFRGWSKLGTSYVAFASPFGEYISDCYIYDNKVGMFVEFTKNYNGYVGNYWTEDARRCFMSFMFNVNNVVPNNPSAIGVYQCVDHCAYPIRLIKDEN